MIFKVNLNNELHNFIVYSGNGDALNKKFEEFNKHTGKTAKIYLSENKFILKVMLCKQDIKNNFFGWFYKNLLKKLSVFKLDGFREYSGYKIAHSIGLKTPIFYCWGSALSPFDDILSFLLISYEEDTVSGSGYFKGLSNADKIMFVNNLTGEIVKLAKHGYSHRDLHLDNFLVKNNGDIIWIDNHFKKLSFFKSKKKKQLAKSIFYVDGVLKDYLYIIENGFDEL